MSLKRTITAVLLAGVTVVSLPILSQVAHASSPNQCRTQNNGGGPGNDTYFTFPCWFSGDTAVFDEVTVKDVSVGGNSNVVIGPEFLNNLAITIANVNVDVNVGPNQIGNVCKDDGSGSQNGDCFYLLNDLALKIHAAVKAFLDGLDLKFGGTCSYSKKYRHSKCH